jgi:hypothetical protein
MWNEVYDRPRQENWEVCVWTDIQFYKIVLSFKFMILQVNMRKLGPVLKVRYLYYDYFIIYFEDNISKVVSESLTKTFQK